jgi:hypothetical protein
MQNARLKIGEKSVVIASDVTTIGRTPDNDISFPEDSNVSRYHAEIESKFGDYWLIDLKSSNGSTVNGNRVDRDILLSEGDKIVLGGSSELVFTFKEDELESEVSEVKDEKANAPQMAGSMDSPDSEESEDAPKETTEPEAAKKSNLPMLFGVAGILFALAIVCVIGAVFISPQCGVAKGACKAKAKITSPETGDTVAKSVDIEVETEDDDCAVKAVFAIGDREVASVSEKPFTASLDPSKFASLSDGFEHALSVVLFDEEGNEVSRSGDVALVFETQEIEDIEPSETPDDGEPKVTPKPDQTPVGSTVSVIDTKTFSEAILNQFSVKVNYKFDPQFLSEVQKKTAEYRSEGYFARASAYKDVINEAFVKEQSLDPALGYILAMSRTKFTLQSDAAGEGLWRMPNEFVATNGYNELCGDNKSLLDPAQLCAAKASSLYLKGLVIGVFESDIISSVAAFGKTPQAANIWKASLPADRTDFWNVIKTPKEREQIVRFFAAAVVIQNPQKFGLKNDRPISELYGFMLQN